MPNLVIASNNKAMPKLDGSLKHKVHDFFEKLNADHTSESPRRVRRLHVDRNYATPSILKPL